MPGHYVHRIRNQFLFTILLLDYIMLTEDVRRCLRHGK